MTGDLLDTLSHQMSDLADRMAASVVSVHGGSGPPSSAVVWRPDLVVAAEDRLDADDRITVRAPDGRSLTATLVGRDPGTNVALLRLAGDAGLVPVAAGDAGTLRVGQAVLAIGVRDGGAAVAAGIVHSLGAGWKSRHGGAIDRLVRLDLRLPPALEGAPLVTGDGRVPGVVTSGPRRSVILIPASTIDRSVDQLVAHGRIRRGFLGAAMQPVRLPEAMRAGRPDAAATAVLLVDVQAGSPADAGGLLPGDIVTAFDGTPVTDPRDVFVLLGPDSVGRAIPISLLRGGAPVEATVTVVERARR